MNEKTKAFIEAVSKTIASEKLFREVITPAQNTFTPSKDIELDRETVQKAIGEALSLLPDAHTAIIWVTNGAECALVDTVAFPNSGDESTCFVAGYATRPDVLAEFFVRRLADYGAFENVDEDTEADVFSYLCEDEGEGEKPTFFREVEEKGKIALKAIVSSSSAPEADDKRAVCPLGKDYEVAIAKFISGYLSKPQTIRDILDGKETAGSSISKAVDIFNS